MERHKIDHMVPGFSDPKLQPAMLQQLSQYAQSMGFTPQEIANIRDRRVLLMVAKAYKYDEVHKFMTGIQ
jgi:hypothetical protein